MSIKLDDQTNDGIDCPGACEGDDVHSDVEVVDTGSGADTIVGGPGHQVFDPGGGTNVVFGGGGPDTFLVPGLGPDIVHGGSGFDTVSYEQHLEFEQQQRIGVGVSLDGVANDGSDSEGGQRRAGRGGGLRIARGGPALGRQRAESPLRLPGEHDVLAGQGGNDVLDGGGTTSPTPGDPQDGNDTFLGGAGSDTVIEEGHTAGMTLSIDGVPNDVVIGQPAEGRDNIYGDVENVVGGPFADAITGSPANNRLVGSGGNDQLKGLEGNDVLVPGPGNDSLFGASGHDTVSFAGSVAGVTASLQQHTATGDGNDVLSSIEAFVGSAFADQLTGSAAADVLSGAGGNDALHGKGGNDRLLGGPGDDTLSGGPGTDTCNQGPGTGSKTGCEL